MDMTSTKLKAGGHKKIVLNSRNTIKGIDELELSKAIADGSASDPNVLNRLIFKFIDSGGIPHVRDAKTGETLCHVLCKHSHYYHCEKTVRIFYAFGTKIDLDVKDHLGDTVLHKICRVPGAWRCIVAIMRCGASSYIKNSMGLTAEDLILHYKHQGWEENLYWLRKYSPSLWEMAKEDKPNKILIAKLFKSWCRTIKVVDDKLVSLKTFLHEIELMCVVALERYEITNEFALAMLAGSMCAVNAVMQSDFAGKIDMNTKDHSYQYSFRDHPTSPRPLLAAVWETGNVEIVKQFMTFKPDTSVKYAFESEATSPPKALFFHLVNPKSRPENEDITAVILEGSDLNIRNEKGETILFEAIYNNETDTVIKTILDCGVNIAARDINGRTARDHCVMLDKDSYRQLIDSHVLKLMIYCDLKSLEKLVFEMYDYIPSECFKPPVSYFRDTDDQKRVRQIIKNIQSTQAMVKKLFSLVKAGNFTQVSKLVTSDFANSRDKAGRSLLHCAVQNSVSVPSECRISEEIIDSISTISMDREFQESESDTVKLRPKDKKPECGRVTDIFRCKHARPDFLAIIRFLVEEYPHITGFTNNLGQTALHYAYIYSTSENVFHILDKGGSDNQAEDVFGFIPQDYSLHQCGEQTFKTRQKPTIEMDLNIFLTESKFEAAFEKAIQTGHWCEFKHLIDPLLEYGGKPYFNHMLFNCLDANRISLASFLIQKGFNTNIVKQYDVCSPDNPICAMLECTHPVTTLWQRAVEVGATDLISLMNKRMNGKEA